MTCAWFMLACGYVLINVWLCPGVLYTVPTDAGIFVFLLVPCSLFCSVLCYIIIIILFFFVLFFVFSGGSYIYPSGFPLLCTFPHIHFGSFSNLLQGICCLTLYLHYDYFSLYWVNNSFFSFSSSQTLDQKEDFTYIIVIPPLYLIPTALPSLWFCYF